MSWSQTDVDELKSAIADGKGVRSVTFADQSVQFSSIKEMLDLLAVMESEVNQSTRRHYRLASVRKGL